MINFIQLNQNIKFLEDNIITDTVWENMHNYLLDKKNINNFNWKLIINDISIKYNMDKKSIMKNYFYYILRKKPELVTNDFLTIVEVIMHSNDSNIFHTIQYFILHVSDYLISQSKIKN